MKYTTIHIQGNLISEEILHKIASGEAPGQRLVDFGFEPGTSLREEIEYAWSRIKTDWKYFFARTQQLPAHDPYGTSLSRRWMEQFFHSLGFDLQRERSALPGENRQWYAISHTATNLDGLPVHIVGFQEPAQPDKNTLDIRTSGGTTRLSPHATMQEYLNVTEHLFGVVTNGLQLRLLRDSGRLIRLVYIEFDLQRMLEEDQYSEFTLMFRLLHASRFPRSRAETDQCWLEKYYQESIESGNRIRDGLSKAVKISLQILAEGLLRHEKNVSLRDRIRQGTLTPGDFYRQLLRLIYRLLFLLVAEERDMIHDPTTINDLQRKLREIYYRYYSISRLRRLSEKSYLHEEQYTDLWQGLRQTFRLFESNSPGTRLGISPLDGDLFSNKATEDLNDCLVSNKVLLRCIRHMHEFRDENQNLVHISYRALDVEELGSVYEGLLDLHPVIEGLQANNPGHIQFAFHEGTERKTTGSYYTRPELVNELIQSALIPVIQQRLREHAGHKEAQEKALLGLKVCDPATGSGHMLLAAARTIAWYLARVRTGEENPAPSIYRQCLRDVVLRCIYGVDKNPMAVELCKVSLWIESHNPGKPLSFLDHKIRCGNSLTGIIDLKVLDEGIPDGAFSPVTGDDKKVCQELKRKNAAFRKKRQFTLKLSNPGPVKNPEDLQNNPQNDVDSVNRAKMQFEELRKAPEWFNTCRACNLWTATFFWHFTPASQDSCPTSEQLALFLQHPSAAYGPMIGKADSMSGKHNFFHWPLEFQEVFAQGGFDVVLTNPPWEQIQLEEQEFFASRDARIAHAPGAARKRLIERLPQENPALWEEYRRALHTAESASRFLRESEAYPLTGRGRINTYSVFAERIRQLLAPQGRAGVILPTGIATDATNQYFFADLVEKGQIVSLFDFENREKLFPAVDSRMKFCLLTLRREEQGSSGEKRETPLTLSFFATRVDHLRDPRRVFTLRREDIARINPNTRTLPVFRTRQDAELTRAIYSRVPVLINEHKNENPWEASFKQGLFNMTSDSHLFRTRAELEAEGYRLVGNRFVRGGETCLPLYEAKMIWHYDHRFGTYEGVGDRSSTHLPTPDERQHADPHFLALPWYWVSAAEVQARLGDWKRGWLLGFRRITNSTNERTAVFTILPTVGAGDNIFLLLPGINDAARIAVLTGNLISIAFDWVVRQKLAGVNMNFFYVEQFPVLPPSAYTAADLRFIVPRVLELTYTAWDLAPFAADVWNDADESLRAALQAQWEANRLATGGADPAPPAWAASEGAPFPPFRWDASRRSVLRAELDAYYARLYGLTRKQLRYLLDPADLTERELADILDPYEEVTNPLDPEEYAHRCARSTFPGETFRVLKEKELRLCGEYRTRRLVLEAWEKLSSLPH